MLLALTLALTSFFGPNDSPAGTKPGLASPSRAYAFVEQPMNEWQATFHAGHRPSTHIAPRDEVQRRAKTWCPAFAVENQTGEELYYLALLCSEAIAWKKAKSAIEKYLSQDQQLHAPEARLLLAAAENWPWARNESWQTLRIVLMKDPIEQKQMAIADSVIEDEAVNDEATALAWSRERYSLLSDRARNATPGAPPVSYEWAVLAGTDLVHRYYLAGKVDDAQKIMDELNHLKEAHGSEIQGLAPERLNWANLEMRAAPPIPAEKSLSRNPVHELIQKGRIEVVSFFFLGCEPCMRELPALNNLQKRYKNGEVLVADVTTYKANSSIDPPTHSRIDAALGRARRKNAPEVSMVVTTDETIANYGIRGFPAVAVIDKDGRLRYIGNEINFEEDDPIPRLLRKITTE